MKTQRILLLAVAILFSTLPVSAVPWAARHGMTSAEYQAEFNKWTSEPFNYRLVSVSGYEVGGSARYAAIWEQGSGPVWINHPGMTAAQFNNLNSVYAESGYVPVFLSSFSVGNQIYYNAIWEHQPGADVVPEIGLPFHDYGAINTIRQSQGYELISLWTCDAGGTDSYAGIWRKAAQGDHVVRVRRSGSEYQQDFNSLGAKGLELISVSTAVVNGAPLYTGVWRSPGTGVARYSHHNLSEVNYQSQAWNWEYQGYRPVFASAFNTAGGRRFNVIYQRNGGMSPDNLQLIDDTITAYMEDKGVPGLSIAISRNGKLAYAKGFGEADQAANEWVHPNHRFRIASVSKPVTAAAMMRVVDYCGLDLDQRVFGDGALLGNIYGTSPYTDREEDITVNHLLKHTTGWTTDGVWQVGGSDPNAVVDWQLDSHNPSSDPGSVFQYMNADHVTAGRVIERRTGRSYEQWVKDELLTPSCITGMEIGGSSLAERKPGEVVYYGGSPYSLNLSRMDANGGWIARPIDLLMLMRRIDGDSAQADLISSNSLMAMLTGSAPNSGYGLGTLINGTWWGHNGCMDGSTAFLVYRDDGIAFAVTCNTRPDDDSCAWGIRSIIDGLIDTLVAADALPDFDLFPCNIPAGNPPPTLEVTQDIYVNGNCNSLFPNGQKNCSLFFGPYPTVNMGVDAVCAGDRLFIRAGTYSEAVVMDRYVTVRSYEGTAVVD